MFRSLCFIFAALILCSSSIPLLAADVLWPGWLGPERNGWVRHFDPPSEWPKELHKVWQVTVGAGYGSPVAAGQRLYQHARQGEEEVVWCLDLQTGATLWRKTYPAPFKMGNGAERHGPGPKSSPALADGRLFTLSITGTLSAWDLLSGERIWRRDFASRFKQNHPYWGAASSPLLDGERLLVHLGNEEEGALFALEAATGKEIWSQGQDGPCYSSPILGEIQGVRQVVEWNHRVIAGVDVESGRLLWEYPLPHTGGNQNMPTPAIHNGCVIVGGENRGIRSLAPSRHGQEWTVHEKWHQRGVALDMSTAVVNGNLLFGFSHFERGRLFCLDPQTGEILWKGPDRVGENVAFLAIPKHVVALLDTGELQIIAADRERYDPIVSWRVAESSTWAPPVLLERGFLIKGLEALTFWSLIPSTSGEDRGP